MSVPYREILRMAAVKVGAVIGTTATAIEAAYITSPLTTTQIGSVNFTISAIKDNLVSVIGRIVRAYASVPNQPFRAYNVSQTAGIANRGLIPSVNSAGKPIVGVYGAFRDATTFEALTEQPLQIIKTVVDDTDNFLDGEYYYFKQVGERLYHTRTSVIGDVCTFSASDEFTAIGANGTAPIPDALLDVAAMGLIASLFVDEEFTAQSSACAQYFEGALAEMQAGKTAFLPAPVLQNSQQPVIS